MIEFAERRRYVPLSALCRSLHARVLISIGDWQRAEAQLLVAVDAYRGRNRPLAAYPLARLADLRLRQGRIDEAERLLAGWETHPEAQAAMIVLLLARGSNDLAAARLEQALDVSGPGPAKAALLALAVELCLARSDVDEAGTSASELADLADDLGHEHVVASAALARGRVAAAAGDAAGARAAIGEAIEGFAALEMPFELARARLEVARLAADDNRELAIAEAQGALEAFERLGALAAADETAELLRSLARGGGAHRAPREQTKRELEVLDLLGEGLSNKEIASRLFISPKTASHHVGHILSKLDLRNRSEAAAYAVRQRRGQTPNRAFARCIARVPRSSSGAMEPTTSTDAATDELNGEFSGDLVRVGDRGYEEAREVFNAMVDRKPALIARCTDTVDVAAALRYGRAKGLPIAVRCGGHSASGISVCDDGLGDRSLRPEARSTSMPRRGSREAGGGLLWGEFDAETQKHGLHTPGGRVTTTGLGGFTTGGGYGWTSGVHGLASDNLVSAQVVTADGRGADRERDGERRSLLGNPRRQRQLRHRHRGSISACTRLGPTVFGGVG